MRSTRGLDGGTGVDVDVDAFGVDDDSRPLDMVGVARRLAAVGRSSRCGGGCGGGGGGRARRQESRWRRWWELAAETAAQVN